MADFGGEMTFKFDGNPLVVRGDLKTEPSNVKVEKLTNQDNSVSRMLAPKGFGAECKFEDTPVGTATGLDWDAILRGGPYNITLVETTTSTLHTWSGANFTGDPKVDRMNGEVTGLEIHARSYKKRSA